MTTLFLCGDVMTGRGLDQVLAHPIEGAGPAARVINLETSITCCTEFAPHKAIHYRMSPGNLPALGVGWSYVCVLANNHVLDFGRCGLPETLGTRQRS